MMGNYDDIRHLNRPISRHPRMHRQDRAKLFAPFAALTGFEDAIHHRDRILVPQIVQTEDARERLDRRLRLLTAGDYVTVVYFLPEQVTLEGPLGTYRTVSSVFLRIDELERRLQLDGATIPLEDIAEITWEELMRSETDDAGLQ